MTNAEWIDDWADSRLAASAEWWGVDIADIPTRLHSIAAELRAAERLYELTADCASEEVQAEREKLRKARDA